MVIVFEYEVAPAERDRFEQVYARDGEWATFFRGGDGYLGSELYRSQHDPARYLVTDRWASTEAYEAFLEANRSEYERRSRATEALYRSESRIGRFHAEHLPAGLSLELLPGTYAACRLDPAAAVPDWARGAELCSVTRTADELSVVCPDDGVPAEVEAERGRRALRVAGRLDLALTGIAAALTTPLAAVGLPVLVIATYETDYLLVRQEQLERAVAALAAAGHRIVGSTAHTGRLGRSS